MLSAVFAAGLSADVTLRYKTQMKMNPTLPPQIAEQATKGMGSALPPEIVVQWKEGKGYSSFSSLRAITDLVKKEITLLDPEKKQFAKTTPDGLADALAKTIGELPAEAKASMAQMKFDTSSKLTGRTETIQGIPAEEREVAITMSGAMGNGASGGVYGPIVNMTLHFWMAKDEDVYKNPALRELKGYNAWTFSTMNPASLMQRMFQSMPGMGENLSKLMKEMPKTMMLRSNTTVRMPVFGVMMKQLPPGQNPFGKNFDPEAPLVEVTQELTEISTATVPASVFAIPEGYQSAPASELVKAMMDRFRQAGAQGAKK
jgi:hypothetical protein